MSRPSRSVAGLRPLLVALALAVLGACQCDPLGVTDKRFACSSSEDCLDGFVCRDVGAGRECVRDATDAGATDGGSGDGGSADGGLDEDRDGWARPADCDDTNPNVHPGLAEQCANQLDDDCNGATDCEDLTCDGRTCRATGATCSGVTCRETECGDQLDNDGDGATDCVDPDCAGLACGAGTCTSGVCKAPTETGLCSDGVDNDGDFAIDCADSDCPVGATCSDRNACTLDDTCDSNGTCRAGMNVICSSPPNPQCFAASGVCQPDAGGTCAYAVRPGFACNDANACTQNDSCAADGGCGGTPVECKSPPTACYAAIGNCVPDAGCRYAPLPSAACNDGDACTVNDTCDGDGGCAGSPVTCVPPGECFQSLGCSADAGCRFSAAPGRTCDGGVCDAMGVCAATPSFPFTPSNFTETSLPTMMPFLLFDCGTTTLNTGSDGGALTWTGNCPLNPSVVSFREIPLPAGPAVLLFVDNLSVAAGSTFRVVGGRPLILAVNGNASVAGLIDVGSLPSVLGAGANLGCGPSAGGNGTLFNGAAGGGGAGGSFGARGGSGGDGDGPSAGGGAGGQVGSSSLVPLRGGCPGGAGGGSVPGSGTGGPGGGALQLTVGGTLTVTGRISAAGAGGLGGAFVPPAIGGGGGGSGGAVLLEANTITIAAGASVTANGGGGGQGAPGTVGFGPNGANGSVVSGAPAPGGSGAGCGGIGGAGGALLASAQNGALETCPSSGGGGGGGGGVGRIYLRGVSSCALSTSAVFSPTARGNSPPCTP